MTLYFVVRTDAAEGSGEQRVFGAWDTEQDAAARGMAIAAQRPGDFSIFEGKPVLNLVKQAAPVTAQPVGQ